MPTQNDWEYEILDTSTDSVIAEIMANTRMEIGEKSRHVTQVLHDELSRMLTGLIRQTSNFTLVLHLVGLSRSLAQGEKLPANLDILGAYLEPEMFTELMLLIARYNCVSQ